MNLLELIKKSVYKSWQDVLKTDEMGGDDSFFDLGGHSLLAAKIGGILGKEWQLPLSISDVLEYDTINKLSLSIFEKKRRGITTDTVVAYDRTHSYPLSLAQNRLWFLYRLRPGISLYSFPFVVRSQGNIDLFALKRALNKLMERHESLRTIVEEREGEAYQKILSPDTEFPLTEEYLHEGGDLQQRIDLKIAQPFYLEKEVLCRCHVLRLPAGQTVLCFLFHHMIFDDWSQDIFARELSQLYLSVADGLPLKKQYLEFSVDQIKELKSERHIENLTYLKKVLSAIDPVVLPLDFPRPFLLHYQAGHLSSEVSSALFQSLHDYASRESVSLFMILLAAFQYALSLFANSRDIQIGSPMSNRPMKDYENVIGYFVNTVVYRINLVQGETFSSFLQRVKSLVLDSYKMQDVPFEKVVTELNVPRNLNKNPLFQVMFSVGYDIENTPVVLGTEKMEKLDLISCFAKFDISLHVQIKHEGLRLHFEYMRELFLPETIARLMNLYIDILKKIVNEEPIILGPFKEEPEKRIYEKTLEHRVVAGGFSYFEDKLKNIWENILQVKDIDYDRTFFELGGNSLLVLQLCYVIKQDLNILLSPIDLFQYPTLRMLARHCGNQAPHKKMRTPILREKFLKALQRASTK